MITYTPLSEIDPDEERVDLKKLMKSMNRLANSLRTSGRIVRSTRFHRRLINSGEYINTTEGK